MHSPTDAHVSRLHVSRISWIDVVCLIGFCAALVSAFAAATGQFHS